MIKIKRKPLNWGFRLGLSLRESEKKMKEYIIEVENADTDTLQSITEALNCFNIRCYVYEKNESEGEK